MKRFQKQQWEQIKNYVIRNFTFVMVMLSLLIGVLMGALLIRGGSFSAVSRFSVSFEQFIQTRQEGSYGSVFIRSFATSSVYLLVLFCCGLFVYGSPLCYLATLMRGLGFGAVSGYLYSTYGLKGVAFTLLVLLPTTFFNCIVLILASKEAVRFSASMVTGYFRGFSLNVGSRDFKQYHKRFFIFLIVTLFISLMDAGLSTVFIHVFGF